MEKLFHEYSVSTIKQVSSLSPIRVDTPSPISIQDEFNCVQSHLEMYRCGNCSFTTHLKVIFNKHMNVVHTLKPSPDSAHFNLTETLRDYGCINCNFQTSSQFMMMKHMNSKCANIKNHFPFKCMRCSYLAKLKNQLTRHINLVHPGFKWVECAKCSFKGQNRDDLRQHVRETHKWFECEQCPYKTKCKGKLREHAKMRHGTDYKLYKCGTCAFMTKWRNAFRRHLQRHK